MQSEHDYVIDTSLDRAGYRSLRGGEALTGLATLLPHDVVVVEAIGAVEPEALFPEEAVVVAGAVSERRLEFARGRSCARRALVDLDVAACAIPSGENREPLWPARVLGSITHCLHYCSAAATTADRWSGVGIDAEQLMPLDPLVVDRITSPGERDHLATLPRSIPWDCVLFSAKESIYKAWYPQMRRWLGFLDVELRFDPERSRFEAEMLIDAGPWSVIAGRFCLEQGRVLTATLLPARST